MVGDVGMDVGRKGQHHERLIISYPSAAIIYNIMHLLDLGKFLSAICHNGTGRIASSILWCFLSPSKSCCLINQVHFLKRTLLLLPHSAAYQGHRY